MKRRVDGLSKPGQNQGRTSLCLDSKCLHACMHVYIELLKQQTTASLGWESLRRQAAFREEELRQVVPGMCIEEPWQALPPGNERQQSRAERMTEDDRR